MVDHFVVVGAQRAGTTYLYGLLDEHPEIEMAKPVYPEPKFFLSDDACGLGLDHYEQAFFTGIPGAWLRGEKSTSYLESGAATRRIAELLPDAHVVAVLRDPVARAISNYRYTVANGYEDRPPAEALCAEVTGPPLPRHPERVSVNPFAYLTRGRYVEHLRRYAECFPTERVHVALLDELATDLHAVADVYAALGVDATFTPAGFGQPRNVSATDDPPVPNDVVAWLRDYFRDADAELAAWLGRPLPWR